MYYNICWNSTVEVWLGFILFAMHMAFALQVQVNGRKGIRVSLQETVLHVIFALPHSKCNCRDDCQLK